MGVGDVDVTADSIETPQWLGVEIPPGSENTAERQRAQREHGRSHARLPKKCRGDKAGPAEQPPGAFGATAAGSERITQSGQEPLTVAKQCQGLNWKLRGHYGYYGITHNLRAMRQYYFQVRRAWHWWLCRRGGRTSVNWTNFETLLIRYPLVSPQITHDLYRPCERSV